MSEAGHRWPGIPLALVSAALFGASTPLAKLLLGVTQPWLLAGLLYLGAGIGLGLISFGRRALRIPVPEAVARAVQDYFDWQDKLQQG